MKSGLSLVSINTFERYIPITPTHDIIIPPRNQIEAIRLVHPSEILNIQ